MSIQSKKVASELDMQIAELESSMDILLGAKKRKKEESKNVRKKEMPIFESGEWSMDFDVNRKVEDNPEKSMVVVGNVYDSDLGYNNNVYDMDAATKEGVVYPSLDPCIFELKFPDTDIEGRVVGDI